jgi:hypothetical protein
MRRVLPGMLCILILFDVGVAQIRSQVNRKYTKARVFLNQQNDLTAKNVTQNRNLNNYDNGGSFDCRKNWMRRLNIQGRLEGLCDENRIRDFVWQQWTTKKRGYVIANYFYIDAGWTHHIFIEPDNNGIWCIRWRIVRYSAISGTYDGILDDPKIVSVEKIVEKRVAISV